MYHVGGNNNNGNGNGNGHSHNSHRLKPSSTLSSNNNSGSALRSKAAMSPRRGTWSIDDFAKQHFQHAEMKKVRRETSQVRDRVDFLIQLGKQVSDGRVTLSATAESALSQRIEAESQAVNDRLQWIRGHVSDGQLKIKQIRGPSLVVTQHPEHATAQQSFSLAVPTAAGGNSHPLRRTRSARQPRRRSRLALDDLGSSQPDWSEGPTPSPNPSGTGIGLLGVRPAVTVGRQSESFRAACNTSNGSSSNGCAAAARTDSYRQYKQYNNYKIVQSYSLHSQANTEVSQMSSLPSETAALSAPAEPAEQPGTTDTMLVVHNRTGAHKPGACRRCLVCAKFGTVDALEVLYVRLGHLIARWPAPFIVCSLLLTIVCAAGMHRVQLSNRIKEGYTPLSARSRHETQVYQQFFASAGADPYTATVLLRPRDPDASLFDKKYFDRVMEVSHYLTHELSVQHDGRNYTFDQFCTKNPQDETECAMHMLVNKVYRAMHVNEPTDSVRLAYPMCRFDADTELNIASAFYEVQQLPANSTDWNTLTDCNLIVLFFQAFIGSDSDWAAATAWELAVYDWAYEGEAGDDPLLSILANGDRMIVKELHATASSMAKFFIVGFALMIVFVFSSVFGIANYHGAARCATVLVAVAALIAPVLAFVATFGIIAWSGEHFYPMMVLAPYLILAIGVDDAFLMMHAWHRVPRTQTTAAMSAVERSAHRLAKVLEEVGPSITVTSATNSLAFGIGAITDTPVIRSFCMTTGIAMVVCFVFELTLFGATLAWVGRGDSQHHELHHEQHEQPDAEVKEAWADTAETSAGTHIRMAVVKVKDIETERLTPRPTHGERRNSEETRFQRVAAGFLDWYTRVISSWPAILLVACLTAGMWVFAVWGAMSIKTKVSIDKILPRTSPLLDAYEQFDTAVWKEFYPVSIIIGAAPQNDSQLDDFNRLRHEFESGPGALGPKYSRMWMDFYDKFREKTASMSLFGFDYGGDEDERRLNYDDIEWFLDRMQMWRNFVHTNAAKTTVTSFMFVAAYKDADNWDSRVEYMQRWRRIADENPQFNVTIWSPNGLNVDAILNLKSITQETVVITLVVMVVICLLFIPSLCGVFAAALAITSTTITVLGSLSWWSIDLDPMSVAAVLMAIGFSVDFTAHTSYHYQKAIFDNEPGSDTAAGRLTYTIESVGFPMVQAGLSTLLCVLPLAFHGDYAPEVLFKAITVLVFWGLAHGLVLLPALLAALPSCATVGRPPSHHIHRESLTHEQMQQLQGMTDKV